VLVSLILESDKSEWLKDASRAGAQWIEHFSHAINVSRMRLKSDFDEIAFGNCDRQLQQASGCGNYLKPAFGADSVAQLN